MRNAINVIGADKCTGCFACLNVCNLGAISMLLDGEGFYKPVVDKRKCTECGVCEKRCPVLNYSNPNIGKPTTYAGWSNNDQIRMSSSSGGVFSEMAAEVIARGGIVFGVKWKDGLVEYSWTETLSGLADFRGSKYLQANVGLIYQKVNEFLKSGRLVLFTGLPCQIAALRNIVKSDKLILVDLACLGTPSIKVYQKYLKETFPNMNITRTNFRSKSTGWRRFSIEFWSDDKIIDIIPHHKNNFFYGFSPKVMYTNTACYNCKFNTIPRCGDLTLADYWGAPDHYDNFKGISAILVNNKIAEKFLGEVKLNMHRQELNQILKGTPRLNRAIHVPMPTERELFFRNMDLIKFNKLAFLYFRQPCKIEKLIYKIVRIVKSI